MKNKLLRKLIAVVNLNQLKLYEAQAIKITEQIEEMPLAIHKTHRHEQGSYQVGYHVSPNPGSAFEPHTSDKDIELLETAKIVAHHLDKKAMHDNKYQELIIIAEPKLLGHLKQQFSKNLKKIISKEIPKDFAHQKTEDIERCIFG